MQPSNENKTKTNGHASEPGDHSRSFENSAFEGLKKIETFAVGLESEIRERATSRLKQTRQFITTNPILAVSMGLGAGFLVGVIASSSIRRLRFEHKTES